LFVQLILLPNPHKNYAFQSVTHPRSASFRGGIYTPCKHVPWTHPTQHPKLYLDRFSRFYTAHGRESLYFTMCAFKKLIAAINAIKDLIV